MLTRYAGIPILIPISRKKFQINQINRVLLFLLLVYNLINISTNFYDPSFKDQKVRTIFFWLYISAKTEFGKKCWKLKVTEITVLMHFLQVLPIDRLDLMFSHDIMNFIWVRLILIFFFIFQKKFNFFNFLELNSIFCNVNL